MSRLRFLTAHQTGALFYAETEAYTFNVLKSTQAAHQRLSKLARNGYIASAPALDYNNKAIKVYFLDRGGADIIRDLREQEDTEGRRFLERKSSYAYKHGPHNILIGDILCNLILLSRTLKTFTLNEWLGDRDCRFYISNSFLAENKTIFDPDLFLYFKTGDTPLRMFLEIERGTNTKQVIRRKILRFFKYFASDDYTRDLGLERFPRSCFIMSNKAWKTEMVKLIAESKSHYEGDKSNLIPDFPFWITSLDQIDPSCITEGRLSISILGKVWTKHTGENNASAFFV